MTTPGYAYPWDEAARAQFGAEDAHGSMEELVGRTDLDAVIVERIQEAARSAGKQVMVGFMKREPARTCSRSG